MSVLGSRALGRSLVTSTRASSPLSHASPRTCLNTAAAAAAIALSASTMAPRRYLHSVVAEDGPRRRSRRHGANPSNPPAPSNIAAPFSTRAPVAEGAKRHLRSDDGGAHHGAKAERPTPPPGADVGVERARSKLVAEGHEAESIWTQVICWGDHDQFQHVNNCHYVRFVESARMRFAESVARTLSPREREDVLRGTGVSFILGQISVRYRRPVVYPDTLVLGSFALLPLLGADRFVLRTTVRSARQDDVVATSDQLCVTYDYRRLAKCEMPEAFREALVQRGKVVTAPASASASASPSASPSSSSSS